MPLRKVILRVMLASLAIAAITGAGAIVMGSYDTIWRVVGTAFATAVAAALMLAPSGWIDRNESRPAGLAALALILLEWVLIVMLTWELEELLSLGDEALGFTALTLPVSGVGAVIALRLLMQPVGRWAGRVLLLVAGVMEMLFLLACWLPGRTWEHDEWWGTGWIVGGYGLCASLTLVGLGTTPPRWWRWLGLAAGAIAAAMAITHIWTEAGDAKALFTGLTAAAVVTAHANVFLFVPLTSGQRWLRIGTFAATIAGAILLTLAVGLRHGADDLQEDCARLAGAALLVAACESLALVVLARFNRGIDHEPRFHKELSAINLICPRCRRKQNINLGGAACQFCHLRINIHIEEPRCRKCGYMLVDLTSPNCPECGTPIAQDGAPDPEVSVLA